MKKEKLLIKINDSEIGRFEIDTFVYKASRKSPAVFTSPVFGGAPFIEHILGRMFAMNGFHAFITDFMPVTNFRNQVPDLHVHDRTYKKAVAGLDGLRNYVQDLPYVEGDKIGLFGMSLGGMFTSINMKLNNAFKASVIIAGSGNHPGILARSKQGSLVALKRKRMKYFNLKTEEDYQYLMNSYNEMDCLKIYRDINPERCLMYIATKDEHVPTSCQIQTWHALGKPRVRFIEKTHYEMILTTPFMYFFEIRDFFREKLC